MYIEDLKNEFYNFLAGKRVFLMVHYDIDSLCSCKILQSLLGHNHIVYSLAIIRGVEDFKTAFRENSEDVKYFILINCGGTIDIVEILEPDDDVIFFVLDSHRPIDLCNIYSNDQIRLLSLPEEEACVPKFEAVFREESDDEEDDDSTSVGENGSDDEGETRAAKRRRLGEEELLRRRERRLWEDRRSQLLFEYSQYTYYARASAITMFELAFSLNKEDRDMLWLAIVALTEQMLFGKLEESKYSIEMSGLRNHSLRLNRWNDTNVTASLKITFEKDLRLVLHRHWSVESSLKYSMFTSCRMKLWSLRGDRKLQQLLAEMGLPLAQSKQNFQSMDLQLKREFQDSIEKLSEKYNLDDIIFPTFILQYGYGNVYSASDFVYTLLAILETGSNSKTVEENFNIAMECVPKPKKETIESGIVKAKTLFRIMFKTVQGALEMKQITVAGPFAYFFIQEGFLDWQMFSNLHVLSLLAQFMLRAYVSMSRNRKANRLALIVSAPKDLQAGTCLLLGVPPLCENSPKSFFGKAFEKAAETIKCDIVCDFFDTSYLQISVRDRVRFLDALTAILS